jgi:pSer/pThr/pTyr-binding forkhead associated (FHA) protein
MKLMTFKDGQLIQELDLVSGQTYTVGRKEGCHIQLDKFPGISREHFEIDQDSRGTWRINVFSEIKLIEYRGQESKEFALEGDGEFLLDPYVFKFRVPQGMSQPGHQFNEMAEHSLDIDSNNLSAIETSQSDEPGGLGRNEEIDDNEDTAKQSFSGLPYIKIIGHDGKKSEYFRLEGNLWVVGGDEAASVYLREPSASPNHFEISRTDKGFFLVDLGSRQGTELNGQKLTSKKPTRLLSGDIITVGSTSLQFELRDKAFKRKVSNIPLNMYKNPLVFFDQEVAMVSLDEPEEGLGSAEEVDTSAFGTDKEKKKKILYAAVVAIVLIAIGSEFLLPSGEKTQQATADPFNQLSPAEQKIVKQTYKLASQLYLNRSYELSLVQLDKLHSIIPVYKDSKKMEEDCIIARDNERQKALREQQRREQEALERQVHSAISQCENEYANSDDVDGVKACLVPAVNLDPNNPRIAQLVTEVEARSEERKIREKMAAEREEKVRRGKELYQRARNLHRKGQWIKAIEAYENHIHSGLPDPGKLVKKSKRKLASIEWQIKSKKSKLLNESQKKYSSEQLRDAIKLAREASEVDPFDPKISAFLFQMEKELSNRMKAIYMDSVIEERYGNLDASKLKWEEILKKDIEDGEYYIKAKRKLKRYGFEY